MPKYIDIEPYLDDNDSKWYLTSSCCKEGVVLTSKLLLDSIPVVDVDESKHDSAFWDLGLDDKNLIYCCSNCKTASSTITPYCSQCGKPMELRDVSFSSQEVIDYIVSKIHDIENSPASYENHYELNNLRYTLDFFLSHLNDKQGDLKDKIDE